ncbi:MAG: FkbM family methyltransferase [Hyphomicrobiaceae bacterium]
MDKPRRDALRRHLEVEVGNDRRGNAILMQHVFSHFAGPGLVVCRRSFGDHALSFDPRCDKIGMSVLAGRDYQRHLLTRALAIVAREGRSGGIFVDVGANIGVMSVYAHVSRLIRHVIAIEPDVHNQSICSLNFVDNGLIPRDRPDEPQKTWVFLGAAGASHERATLHLDGRNFGRHSLVPDAVATPAGTAHVDVRPLDDWIELGHGQVSELSLVKIDVEGYELDVLRGASQLMAARVPIMVELTGCQSDRHRYAAFRDLVDRDYTYVADLTHLPNRDTGFVDAVPISAFVPTADQHDLLVY